jgi:hypothetical protein
MASTRNKNTLSDYRLEQLQNARYGEQCVYLGNAACHPGNGITGGGRVGSQLLAHNHVDVESDLRGIVFSLVEKRDKVVPNPISLPSLSLYPQSNHVILPTPLVVDKYNRPFYY